MNMTKTFKLAIMFLTLTSITACNARKSGNEHKMTDSLTQVKDSSQFVLKHLGVDKKKLMPYVTCSEQMVDSLLAVADTIYSNTGNYKLENLEMGSESYNKSIKQDYNDTIPTIIALLSSYDKITNAGVDEAGASFVWHEVARMQIKRFFEASGMKCQETNDPEILFKVVNGMMWTYGSGSQADMNGAAWYAILPADYRLIDAYKQLGNLCNDKGIVKLIHDDYMHILKVRKEHVNGIESWYSDLARVEGELFKWIFEVKLENVKRLIKQYKCKQIEKSGVRTNLNNHMCYVNKKMVKLTKGLLDKKVDDFQ